MLQVTSIDVNQLANRSLSRITNTKKNRQKFNLHVNSIWKPKEIVNVVVAVSRQCHWMCMWEKKKGDMTVWQTVIDEKTIEKNTHYIAWLNRSFTLLYTHTIHFICDDFFFLTCVTPVLCSRHICFCRAIR